MAYADPQRLLEYGREYRQRRREYIRDKALRTRYGITAAEKDAMLLAQGGCCAICQRSEPGGRRAQSWHVDHDHETGKVRALLCLTCNTGLGNFGDEPSRLEAAARYLNRNGKF